MAAPDFFTIIIRGKGGHAAIPERSIDPIVCAAELVTSLQSIVSRELDPSAAAVISVCTFHAGTAKTVIPEAVGLGGTVRTFDEGVRAHVRGAMDRMVDSIASAHRCEAEFDFQLGYAVTRNDAEIAALVRRNVPQERLHEIKATMAGEDFSAYGTVAPACFFIVGAGGPNAFPHHHPRFVVDEAALSVAHDVFVETVLGFLSA